MKIDNFGVTKDGQEARLYTFGNDRVQISVTDFGANLVNVLVLNNSRTMTDICLGYDDVTGYENDNANFGANVGRVANRIAGAEFTLNGKKYELEKNDNGNCLHSGGLPYSKRMWSVKNFNDNSVTFSILSPDGDQGYPGNLKINITYTATDEGFDINYEAETDADTVVSITNHSYFNLNGHDAGDVTDHVLRVSADCFTPINKDLIPTGEIRSVEDDMALDFRVAKQLCRDIDCGTEQVSNAGGYDHNYCFCMYDESLKHIISMISLHTGIEMRIFMNYPGVQMYTGNFMNDIPGKNGAIYPYRGGICFEPQFYPNAVNQDGFLSPILKAGQKYKKMIRYKFY